jgi:hypothetical protein
MGKRLHAEAEQLRREKPVLAWLFCHEQLATGIADSTFNHQVIAHPEVLDGVAQLVQIGCASASMVGFWGLSVLKRHNPLQPLSTVASRGVLTFS